MLTKSYSFANCNRCNFNYVLLAFFSGCGFIAGVLISYSADPSFYSLMRMAACRPVSIVDLLIIILIPFIITAAVSFIGRPWLLFPLSLFKSLTYGLAFASASLAFGSSGWLVSRWMLLTDTVCMPLLFWYWLRHINGFTKTAVSDLAISVFFSLLVGIADSFLVSPYLAALLKS